MNKIFYIFIPVGIIKFQNRLFVFDRIRIAFPVPNQSVFRQCMTVEESDIKGKYARRLRFGLSAVCTVCDYPSQESEDRLSQTGIPL